MSLRSLGRCPSLCTSGSTNISSTFGKIDTVLYNSYNDNDLRKIIFFRTNADGSHAFKGSYNASSSLASYNGIAVDEMYLIRAECSALMGNINAAMDALNTLLVKRWKIGTFSPYETTDPIDALNYVLKERRKELLYRSLRFSDIKRLNRVGKKIIMKRVINGTTYTLEPNDKRYALPIPDNVIQASGIQRN